MATTLTPHPEFVFVFAAVRRADRHPRILHASHRRR